MKGQVFLKNIKDGLTLLPGNIKRELRLLLISQNRRNLQTGFLVYAFCDDHYDRDRDALLDIHHESDVRRDEVGKKRFDRFVRLTCLARHGQATPHDTRGNNRSLYRYGQ